MKPLLCLMALSLPLIAAVPATAAPAACRAEAIAAVKQTAAYRHGSVREKQALLRSQSLRPCAVKA
ncbi:hypothetical protein [Asticcacaulis sp.]|jgi:hypothetical protein|uniref:hypothetical protein n=1 Tax=Asticcacaulis sp. TaxID=1872648 RepID=UPI0031D9CAEC